MSRGEAVPFSTVSRWENDLDEGRTKLGRYGVINIAMHPHPPGTYRELFTQAAQNKATVRYYGERYARISPLTETSHGIFSGRLATWSEIDPTSKAVKKLTLEEVSLDDSGALIPQDTGFNSRIFSFSFRESDHRLFIELINDENETLSIGNARKAIQGILETTELAKDRELQVYVVSTASVLDQIFALKVIKRISIEVTLPNEDVLSTDQAEIIRSMKEMNAGKLALDLTKAKSAASLEPSAGVKALAEISVENGHTRAIGSDLNGRQQIIDTESFPLEIKKDIPANSSRAAQTRVLAEQEGLPT